jgi:hypothetical protein
MKIVIFVMFIFSLYGCTYTAKPYPVELDMVSHFQSNSSIHIVNTQTEGVVKIENSDAGIMNVNLKQATDAAVALFRKELEKKGIKHDALSGNTIGMSLEKFYKGNYLFAFGCTATLKVETSSGLSKKFKEHNISGIGLPQACNFAITKAVASVMNDQDIRRFIDPSLN